MKHLSEEKGEGTAGAKAWGLELPAWDPERKPVWLEPNGQGREDMTRRWRNTWVPAHVGQIKGFGFDSKSGLEFTRKSIPGRGTALYKGPEGRKTSFVHKYLLNAC